MTTLNSCMFAAQRHYIIGSGPAKRTKNRQNPRDRAAATISRASNASRNATVSTARVEHIKQDPMDTDLTDIDTIYIKKLKTVSIRLQDRYRPDDVGPTFPVETIQQALSVLSAIFAQLDDEQEHLLILVLSNGSQVNGYKVLSSGAKEHTAIDLRLLFRSALLLGAESIILAHNHPSGNIQPSDDDIALTARIAKAAALLSMPLIDHIVFSPGNYCSMLMQMPELFSEGAYAPGVTMESLYPPLNNPKLKLMTGRTHHE